MPKALMRLHELVGASPREQLVAMMMADHSISNGRYPTFHLKQTELAQKTGLSERTISDAIKFLTSKKLVSVRYRNGSANQYTWNETFFLTPEIFSVVPLKNYHSTTENTSVVTTENNAGVYIEYLLEYFKIYLEGFFAPDKPQYKFYIPVKRGTKRIAGTTPADSGYRHVDRFQAWSEATWKIWGEVKNEQSPLLRLFCALVSGNLDEITFPESALRYRVHNSSLPSEVIHSLKLQIYCDEDVRDFLKAFKLGKGGNA